MNNFNKDLEFGEKVERYCIKFLKNRYGTLKKAEGEFKYYDLYNDTIKLEVKFDRESIHTGHLVVETSYRGSQSGVMDTQADRWIEIFGFYGIWYMADISVASLREYISEASRIKGGDNKQSSMVLLDIEPFMDRFSTCIESL